MRANQTVNISETEAGQIVYKLAQEAYHRMEIGKLQTGAYTTNVMVDISLPQGVLWNLEAFDEDSYQLRFVADSAPGYAWLVSPEGVRVIGGT